MTGQERPAFVAGDQVNVTIRFAEVKSPPAAGWLTVRFGGLDHELPLSDEDVAVERVAPAEWPPEVGDLWRDADGDLWFATVKAARTGDDGRVFEGARLVMSPARETPNLYREQRISPNDLLSNLGPVALVHREPQPEPGEDGE
ncbi:hypothetical protein ACGFI9_12275 [Micromonospora sp. NPDC048930]|uniref:hypothetical protein n=1 Tax=Micromonospora sp. NPDC048930 TaxID=3364261 RepID=UPI0037141919